MRSQLGKSVRAQFKLKLSDLRWEFVLSPDVIVPAGYYVYSHRCRQGYVCFILLAISPRRDSFTVEIAWSNDGQLPSQLTVDFDFRNELPSMARVRLSQLSDVRSDKWWHLSKQRSVWDDFENFTETPIDEAITQIPIALDEVFDELQNKSMPLFERVIATHYR